MTAPQLCHTTNLGALYQGDATTFLRAQPDRSGSVVFADPPFNLGKDYGRGPAEDRLEESEYVAWCGEWIREGVRALVPGGAFFLYNLPRWNVILGEILRAAGMQFRNWIAVSVTNRPPIRGRLYPAHYSLLYYTKGEPRVFRRIRTPYERCRHCGGLVRDYGGHAGEMKPEGVGLKDVWTDTHAVYHRKHRAPGRVGNVLPVRTVRRALSMSTVQGDLVLDPFTGSGTVPIVCEHDGLRWRAVDLDASVACGRLIQPAVPLQDLDWVESAE